MGFEDYTSADAAAPNDIASRTYISNADKGTVQWSSGGQDKVIFAFDDDGTRHTFNATGSTSASKTRTFACTTWPSNDEEIKMVLWTGQSASNETSSISGMVVSGSSLKLKATQAASNTNSFDGTVNTAVMKPGDSNLRSVFGFLRVKNQALKDCSSDPALASSPSASIKQIVVTAKDNDGNPVDLAGNVKIDYSSANPVVSFDENYADSRSQSITYNTRFANKPSYGYEAGYIYIALLPGTYHNLKLTITPLTAESYQNQNAATGNAYTITAKTDVQIVRGKYTDGGNLPYRVD